MAKAVLSSTWFCRVDGVSEFLKSKMPQLAEQSVRLLAAYHLGEKKDNPHMHFVIQLYRPVQKQSFALRVKELFGIEKKTQYALEVWDGQDGHGACSYLFHEESAVILHNKSFSDDQIETAKLANDAVQRVVTINKAKASTKLIEKAANHFLNNEFSKVNCIEFMLQAIKDGEHYHPGEFMLKRYTEEIEVRMCNNIRSLAYSVAARLWKD